MNHNLTHPPIVSLPIVMTLLFCAAVLVGCSQGYRPVSDDTKPEPIRLQGGVSTSTKAVINTGDEFASAVVGWETDGVVDYGIATKWLSTATITATNDISSVALTPVRSYSQDAAVKTYMKAWSPEGILSDDGTVSFDGTPDGTTDILLAGTTVGSAIDSDAKTLSFQHPLTQFKFMVSGTVAFGDATTLTSIMVKSAALPTGLSLATDAVTYGSAADLLVPGITSGQTTITSSYTAVGAPVMVKPFSGKTFLLDVTTSVKTYTDVVVTIDDEAFVAGKAYTITLNFGGVDISVGSSVTEWTSGSGSGQVVE